jgi:hypothetical protein
MITVNYAPSDPNSIHMNDGDISQFVIDTISTFHKLGKPNTLILIGQESIITQFRVAVKQQLIDNIDIIFHFNEERIPVYSNGRVEHWPTGFCDLFDTQLDILLDL